MNDTNSSPAVSAGSAPLTHVFEVVEQNAAEDNYYTHGVFLSLEDAIAVVEARGVYICHDPQEYARVEIRQRHIGLYDGGKVVWERAWEVDYETDSFNRWRVVPTARPQGSLLSG